MKKIIIAALALASATVLADQNDYLLSFSTKGPDRYANGDPVADKECYCVVWTKLGCSFEGFNADGSAKGAYSKVLCTAAVALKGHCDATFQIGHKLIDSLGEGKYGVYLLDTRDVSGKPQGVVRRDGVLSANAINNWGLIEDATTELEKMVKPSGLVNSTSKANKTEIVSSVPPTAAQPTITDIALEGDQVKITVADTETYLQYTVEEGDDPTVLAKDVNGAATQGNKAEVITITRPLNGAGAFFKVIRN